MKTHHGFIFIWPLPRFGVLHVSEIYSCDGALPPLTIKAFLVLLNGFHKHPSQIHYTAHFKPFLRDPGHCSEQKCLYFIQNYAYQRGSLTAVSKVTPVSLYPPGPT